MKLLKFIIPIVALVASCAPIPQNIEATPPPMPDAVSVSSRQSAAGAMPSTGMAESAIMNYFRGEVRPNLSSSVTDPDSAMFAQTQVHEFGVAVPDKSDLYPTHYGYLITTRINLKDRQGVYTGYNPWSFIYSNGKIAGDTRFWYLNHDIKLHRFYGLSELRLNQQSR